jgi:hypothetical protein
VDRNQTTDRVGVVAIDLCCSRAVVVATGMHS